MGYVVSGKRSYANEVGYRLDTSKPVDVYIPKLDSSGTAADGNALTASGRVPYDATLVAQAHDTILIGTSATNGVELLPAGYTMSSNAIVEFKVRNAVDSVLVLGSTTLSDRFIVIWADGSGAGLHSNAGSPTFTVDGVPLDPQTRHEMYGAISNGLEHVIRATSVDMSSWTDCTINSYSIASASTSLALDTTDIYDVRIDLDSDGLWNHHWRLYGIGDLQDRIGSQDATLIDSPTTTTEATDYGDIGVDAIIDCTGGVQSPQAICSAWDESWESDSDNAALQTLLESYKLITIRPKV